ncbi:hypothetical protein ACHAW5_003128 [Stephanodiscus triporus]|uniref:Uncharacterized protein n=1 Tax=Stephanodiscus triporus TaxID=2934178 RepID=A0ABD3N4X6_9STRA
MQRPGVRQQAVRKLGIAPSRGGYGRRKSGLGYLVAHPEVVVFGLCLLWLFGCVKLFVNKDAYQVSQMRGGGQMVQQLQVPPLMPPQEKQAQVIQAQQTLAQNKDQSTEMVPEHYMTFSTACSSSQNWESFMFFFYAHKVGQPGKVVRNRLRLREPHRFAALLVPKDEQVITMRGGTAYAGRREDMFAIVNVGASWYPCACEYKAWARCTVGPWPQHTWELPHTLASHS